LYSDSLTTLGTLVNVGLSIHSCLESYSRVLAFRQAHACLRERELVTCNEHHL
jgi:hypothetical protein